MKEASKIYFTVAWIVAMITGAIYSLTIVGLIIGIPLFIGGSKFNYARGMSDDLLVKNRSTLLGWGVFFAVVLAPTVIGTIVVLVLALLVNDYIKNLEKGNYSMANRSFGESLKEGTASAWRETKEVFSGKSDLEKERERLEELKKMKDEGVITEEEYEAKRKKILGL